MREETTARCGACAAWQKLPPAPGGQLEIGAPARGVCLMFPPVPVPQFDTHGRVIGQGHLRPVPMENEHCLHFVARDARPESANDPN